VDFELDGHRLILKNLPTDIPDTIAGVTIIKMEFDEVPQYKSLSYYPHMDYGRNVAGELVQN
jgi:hypothetical protein